MNSVTTEMLDISIDDNDVFDAERSRTGKDRWLYFRYTLEIDPVADVAPGDYLAAVGALLKSLWSSGMDAVSSSDFEAQLPRNVRRLKWARTPHAHGGDAVRVEMIGQTHVVVPVPSDLVAMDACVRMVHRQWPEARFEDVATGKKYRDYGEIPLRRVQELLAYLNAQVEAAWDAGELPPYSMLHLIRSSQFIPALLDDLKISTCWPIIDSIRDVLGMDILNTYAEAA